jgi:hypothetical protein
MDHERDDFNSSDLEFEERPNPFFAAGMSSIQAIMDHALEDRIQSKKLSKTLTHAEGSPKTEYTVDQPLYGLPTTHAQEEVRT